MFDLHPLNTKHLLKAFSHMLDKGYDEEQIQALITTPYTDEVAQAIAERFKAMCALNFLSFATATLPITEEAATDIHNSTSNQLFAIGWQAAVDYISLKGFSPSMYEPTISSQEEE